MKSFLQGIGFIILLLVASFGGDFMRDSSMGDSLNTYILLGLFAVLAYYVNKQKEQISELQQDKEKTLNKVKKLKDRVRLLELKVKGTKAVDAARDDFMP